MKALFAALVVVLTFGCMHAQKVEPGPEERGDAKKEQAGSKDEQGEAKEAQPPTPAQQKQKQASDQAANAKDARPAAAPGRPQLSASPEGMMVPEGPRQLQEALRKHGHEVKVTGELDEATSAAVRAFQGDKKMARTGVPDRETLRALGLDPEEVLRRPEGQQQESSGR